MFKGLIIFSTLIILGYGSLVIFHDKNHDISNYLKYFSTLDDLIVLRDNFTYFDYINVKNSYEIRGYIYPGGWSNITNKNSNYWRYVNLTYADNKPIIAICSGFQHLLKKMYPSIKLVRCFMYNHILDNKLHNHKWCIKKSPFLSNLTTKYFKFYDNEYLESYETPNIFATTYHPEKVNPCVHDNKIYKQSISDLITFSEKLTPRKKMHIKPFKKISFSNIYYYSDN